MPRLPHKRKLSQSHSRTLPLPTMQENDAMIGQTLWPNSTGKGLASLAGQGRRKLNAIALADKQEGTTSNVSGSSSASHDANKAPLRAIEEQNAITGKTFWPESTGKATIPLANQVAAREQAAKSAQDRQARLKALSPADRRRAARHGIDRAEQNAERRGPADTSPPTTSLDRAGRLQARIDRASPTKLNREPGNVYITGHRVGGIGPYHTAIEYISETGESNTFSAAPNYEKGDCLRNGLLGDLSSIPDRPEDDPSINAVVGKVQLPDGSTAADYFNKLQEADSNYCDCINYDLFPEVTGNHNSNSFARGLLEATGGKVDIDWTEFPGGERPLPPKVFRKAKP